MRLINTKLHRNEQKHAVISIHVAFDIVNKQSIFVSIKISIAFGGYSQRSTHIYIYRESICSPAMIVYSAAFLAFVSSSYQNIKFLFSSVFGSVDLQYSFRWHEGDLLLNQTQFIAWIRSFSDRRSNAFRCLRLAALRQTTNRYTHIQHTQHTQQSTPPPSPSEICLWNTILSMKNEYFQHHLCFQTF